MISTMKKTSSTLLTLSAPGGRKGREQLQPVAAAPGNLSDSDMGVQLTAQYKRAVSGMREVLIFGAMLKQVENSLSNVDTLSVRGRPQTGHGIAGGGLKGWLEANAPEISRPTALRFLGVTEAIAEEYMQIVGAKVAKAYDLPSLVLADASTLDAHAALKQGELFDYVAGTSQRSWLDRYKPAPEPGGGYHPKKQLTLPEADELARMQANTAFKAIHRALWDVEHTRKASIAFLPDMSRDLEAQMDIIHIEQAALDFLKLVQGEIIKRGAQPTKYRL